MSQLNPQYFYLVLISFGVLALAWSLKGEHSFKRQSAIILSRFLWLVPFFAAFWIFHEQKI